MTGLSGMNDHPGKQTTVRYTAQTRRGHVRWTVSLAGVGPAEHRDNLAGVNLLGGLEGRMDGYELWWLA
jgi:hypothetical protein